MHISSMKSFQPTAKKTPNEAKATAENKEFAYNPQDPAVMKDHPIEVNDVKVNDGKLETDTVKLANKKAVFGPFGQLRDIKDDPNFTIPEKADGTFNYEHGEELHTAANVFGGAAATVDKYNEVYGEMTGKQIDWAFDSEQLGVSPETGDWPNAFYARQLGGVHFFDTGNTSTGNSGEVVAHEVGHAVLDAIRPNYFSGTNAETGAFHEAFGDVLAFLMTLGDDAAIDKLVAQTGGDLSSKRNFLSDMGEDFGNALGREGGIRNSFNTFTYKDPATLPERGDETQLGHEVHDFSRLWSGAFYDVLDGIADANRAAGMSPKEALKATGEEGWKLLVGQMEHSPAGSDATFKKMAAALMDGDKQFNGGARQELIGDIMVRRELLTPEQASGLFKSDGPAFSGEVVAKEVTLGGNMGMLAGVKVETMVDQPLFSAFTESTQELTSGVEKGVQLMLQNDQILFSEDGAPDISELFKPNGEAYKAYVSTNEAGERELHRVPIVVCDHGHEHVAGHDHHHGHSH